MNIQRNKGIYEKYVKRMLDILCAMLALLFFGWLYLILAFLVRIKMGSPILFKQVRPGMIDEKTGKERLFSLYKFRTMTDEQDEKGALLPDEKRLTIFGKWLRSTSLDELPEAFNIIRGEMSIIGPRPQLVKDMVFMTEEQRMRHTAKPGLSGLAQVKGRNAISWEEKLELDIEYTKDVCFTNDLKIVFMTVRQVFLRRNKVENKSEVDIVQDYGEALLSSGKITQERFDSGIMHAQRLLEEYRGGLS